MLKRIPTSYIALALSALAGLLPTVSAKGDSPRVTAVLSNSQVVVGETVQLQIRVTGAQNATPPTDISIDGLEIHATGTSRQYEMHNLDVTSSVTYNYTILPLKPGAYRIPPQKVRVGTSTLETPELQLAVNGSPGGTARGNPVNPNNPQAQPLPPRLAYAELLIPKKTAYVGEMIPVVIRLVCLTHGQVVEPPQFDSQGFTVQKLQGTGEPQIQTIDGRQCEVFSFKTAIAAARPGKLEIDSIKSSLEMVVPRQTQQNRPRRRSPFDIFDMDDPFSDPFFSNAFGGYRQTRQVLSTLPTSIEIKPLPNNAPPEFSGAVGNFSMEAEAQPKNVQVGDPITITANISGRGNFDRMTAPTLQDDRGWHQYPPSGKFKQDDEVGISGTKSFEMVLSPNERKQAIPPLQFAYFDPQKEQYVRLKSDAIPIRVEGGAAPAIASASAPPVPSAAAPATRGPGPEAKSTPPAQQDILYQLTDRPARIESFAPLYMSKKFWVAQLIPLLALLGLIGWKVQQRRMQDREARRISALQHEASDLLRTLRRDGVSPQEYYTRASRAVRIKTALALKVDPNVVDLEAVATAFHLDESSRVRLQRLFERSDEVKYSGEHNGSQTVAPEQRRETLELIESLRS